MKMPRAIEWRAGAVLLGAAALILALGGMLAQLRTNVRLELTGTLEGGGRHWVFSAQIPERRLPILRQCRRVILKIDPEVSGDIGRIDGQWEAGANDMVMRVWIVLDDPWHQALADSSRAIVRIAFSGQEGEALVKVLATNALNPPRL